MQLGARLRSLGTAGLAAGLAAAALAATACGTDANDAGVAGTYAATQLVVVQDGESTDALAAGLSIAITLDDDGTTTGRLVLPAEFADDGRPDTLSLAGTYAYDADANTVTFEHDADTFIRDVPWTVDGAELHATFADQTGTVTATLRRQD